MKQLDVYHYIIKLLDPASVLFTWSHSMWTINYWEAMTKGCQAYRETVSDNARRTPWATFSVVLILDIRRSC